jgi:hypothetical protein
MRLAARDKTEREIKPASFVSQLRLNSSLINCAIRRAIQKF